MSELARLAERFAAAKHPEGIFGPLDGSPAEQLRAAKHLYRRFARVCHEDLYVGTIERQLAQHTFATLTNFWARCQEKIKAGTYGQLTIGTVSTKTDTYQLQRVLATGDLSTVYVGAPLKGTSVVVKVALAADCNALLEQEVKVLLHLASEARSTAPLLPTVLSSFLVKQPGGARRVTIFPYDPEYRGLSAVRAQYPRGLDGRHVIWIFKRLLSVLAKAHETGYVHGAVLPPHFMLHPKNHGALVLDWSFATAVGSPLTALSTPYKEWYPPEVAAKRPVGPSLDLYMTAQLVCYLLGASPRVLPDTLPDRLRRVFRPCLLANPSYRPSSAWMVYDDLCQAALRVYGKPTFVPLELTAAEGV